jgi:hypothetical protein
VESSLGRGEKRGESRQEKSLVVGKTQGTPGMMVGHELGPFEGERSHVHLLNIRKPGI